MVIAFACRNIDYTIELTYKALNIYEKIVIIEKSTLQKNGTIPHFDIWVPGQIIINSLSELVINIIRKSDAGTEKPVPQLIRKAVTYLFKNFRDDISLSELAEQLHVSVNYLGVSFRNSTGVPFREYLNMLRLKYSCRLLLASDLSVKEVAYASGYKTNEHFLRVFKHNLNMTPSEYRRKNRTSLPPGYEAKR